MLWNPKNDNPAVTLLKSFGLLREVGWCQNACATGTGPICIDQAIHDSAPDAATRYDATALLANHLGYQDNDPSGFIMNWQDDPARTFADVIGAMEGAAMMPSQRETP